MQHESGDEEITLKRVEQVKKQFKEQLLSEDFKRERFMLKLIPLLTQEHTLADNKNLYKEVKKFVMAPVKGMVEDGEILRYRAWLAPKVAINTDSLGG